jgi:CO/xanthine dehydrogenase Mo-binding subunit
MAHDEQQRRPLIGADVIRSDVKGKLNGQARYIDDIDIPGCWHGALVRSPVAHGRLTALERDPDFNWEQVCVVLPEDIPGKNMVDMMVKDMPFLADDIIRYKGEPLALVAASTRELAQEAASRFCPQIEELPTIYTLDEVVTRYRQGGEGLEEICSKQIKKGDVQRGFEDAAQVIEGEYWAGHHEQAYLEPQGMVAIPQDDGGVFIEGSMQCPYFISPELVETLDLPLDKIRVRQAVVGGAFGGKEDYPTWLAGYVSLLAMKSGHPVKIVFDRHEDMLFTPKRHPCWTHYRTGIREDGSITAIHVEYLLDAGAYTTLSPIVLARGVLHAAIGYRCDNVFVDGRVYRTHTVPCGAFRGFGAPQAFWGWETHIERMAEACGQDPHTYRLAQCVSPGDTTATGQVLGPDEAAGNVMTEALKRCAFDECLKRSSHGNPDQDSWYGIGLSFFSHGAAFTGDGEARIKARAAVELDHMDDGRPGVIIRASSVEMGQGAHTVLAQIVADALSIDFDHVRFPLPDTFLVPDSGPTVASRTTMVVGNTLFEAAAKMKKTLEAYASERFFEGQPCQLQDGIFRDQEGREQLFAAVAEHNIKENGITRVEHQYLLDPKIKWNQDTFEGDSYPSYSWGCNIAEVEVNPRTYEIKLKRVISVMDIGRVINPMLAKGQVEGGLVQAFGYALLEGIGIQRAEYDASRFQSYIIPTMMDVPEMDIHFIEYPYTFSPPGAKGLGELPIDGLAPAVGNAVYAATGVRLDRIPLIPERLFEAMNAQQ